MKRTTIVPLPYHYFIIQSVHVEVSMEYCKKSRDQWPNWPISTFHKQTIDFIDDEQKFFFCDVSSVCDQSICHNNLQIIIIE